VTPVPSFEHLERMTDRYGTYEHADGSAPRPEHGYCTDDMARVLVVASREPDPSQPVSDLARQALRFVADAQGPGGDCRNRRDRQGQWRGPYEVGDPWAGAFGASAQLPPAILANWCASWLSAASSAGLNGGHDRPAPWRSPPWGRTRSRRLSRPSRCS